MIISVLQKEVCGAAVFQNHIGNHRNEVASESKTTYCMTQSQNKPVTLTDAISLDRSEIRCFRSHSGTPDSGNHRAKFPKQKLLKQTSFVLCEHVRELVNRVRVLSVYVGLSLADVLYLKGRGN